MENSSWVTEALVQFIKSPMWLTPVNHFIDENCNIFTDDNEMKLEYTAIHRKFESLVDDLLSGFVSELGVSLEDATSAVRASMQSGQELEHKPVEDFMKYIYVMDDFESFYRMMIKRNVELDIIAIRALQAKGVNLSVEDSENLLSSIDRLPKPTPMDVARVMETNGRYDDEEALRRAISESLLADPKVQEKKLEEVKLKEALALSAQAERDRAQFLASNEAKEVQQPSPKGAEVVAGKAPEIAVAHQTQVKHEVPNPSHPKFTAGERPVVQVPEGVRQTPHTEAPSPTSVSQKDLNHPLPALTTSKPQQTLGNMKLKPLPPI